MAIVYLATNRVNGKRYVGATKFALSRRSREHIREALRGGDNCRKFHRSIRKHGPEVFDWIILAECADLAAALTEERRLISEIRPEYNIKAGGQGSSSPRHMSAEVRARWRAKMVGRKYGPEHGEKTRRTHLGRKRSDEARARMSASRKGIKFSESQLQNMRLAQLGKKQSAETIEKRRKAWLGRSPTQEHREKIRLALRGRPHSPERIANIIEGRRRSLEAKRHHGVSP